MLVRTLMAAALVLTGASKAAAQASLTTSSPSYELSAGYQFLHLPDMNFPFGLGIDGAMHFGRLGLVAEGGWALHAEEDDVADIDFTTNMWHLAAGARFTGFRIRTALAYAQVASSAPPSRTPASTGGWGGGGFSPRAISREFFDEPDDVEDSINNSSGCSLEPGCILD